jgi:hypothetical protein
MHPALAETTTGTPRFYWNLDNVVGLNGVNKMDDVLFVQWCFYKMGGWQPASQIWPGLKKVNINGNCTGRPNDPLVETIKLAEAVFGGEMDGRVSPIKTSAKFSFHGHKYPFLIMVMNIALSQLYPQQYPRLDLMPEFIWRIKEQVVYPFVYQK